VFRRMLIGGFTVLLLLGVGRIADAQVSVNIGINLPAPPALVAIPSSPVTYAPSVGANFFFYGGQYFVFQNGGWFMSARYNGPWAAVAPEYVPRPILGVPVRYYRHAPAEWRHARREGPPPWAAHYGRRWEEGDRHHEGFRDDHRDEHHHG